MFVSLISLNLPGHTTVFRPRHLPGRSLVGLVYAWGAKDMVLVTDGGYIRPVFDKPGNAEKLALRVPSPN